MREPSCDGCVNVLIDEKERVAVVVDVGGREMTVISNRGLFVSDNVQ